MKALPADIVAARKAFANALALCAEMTPREQAEAAWTPTCTESVDQLEDLIRAERGLPPLSRQDNHAA